MRLLEAADDNLRRSRLRIPGPPICRSASTCKTCQGPRQEASEVATNKEVVEAAYASFARGDVPAVLGAMADDIQWTEADGYPLAGTYVGPQAVLEGVFMRLGESATSSPWFPTRSSQRVTPSWLWATRAGSTRTPGHLPW